MKLVYYEHGIKIEFRENRIQTLVLEHPKVFTQFLRALYEQSLGGEGPIVLSDSKDINLQKEMELILSPFEININSKKIIGQLYRELQNIANETLEEKFQINSEIVNYLEQLIWKSSYENLKMNLMPKWENLFKLYEIQIDTDSTTLFEKLIEYLKVCSAILKIRLYVFVNLRQYFEEFEIIELIEWIKRLKIHVLLIESVEPVYNADTDVYIIDQDYCWIEKIY
ncbi:type II-A CRISPR-associated protein Csn2 [uncultured Dubosiella sp.]|uniref:type II-A CRISPR-associated protein Csn2 n=1 Tax=uncultured Dubosiella sp. TaxID=1937011 RepID=UPI0025B5003F|nr:type II-A CRISPR-associated protein Csn2 [uncultured Dubosiella sp.]